MKTELISYDSFHKVKELFYTEQAECKTFS